jgi:Winged helix DNA-binding domain
MGGIQVSRAAVLAYRAAAHDLERPASGLEACGVLEVGVQDTPPGTTASRALEARLGRRLEGDPSQDGDHMLAHSLRGTMHLHRRRDLGLLTAALRPDTAADLSAPTFGGFFAELAAAGTEAPAAVDMVATSMTAVMADGLERTKGELSTQLRRVVPERLRPWCPGCRVHHVHDGLFRMATLVAGLTLRPLGDGSAVFQTGPSPTDRIGPREARAELVRRFVRRCGPSTHHVLGAWIGATPKAARRWCDELGDDLVAVDVEGRRLFMHRDDVDVLRYSDPPTGIRVLPPYDPIVEIADREVVLPDTAHRRLVWRAAANPGTVLVSGDLVGVWRRRRRGRRVTVTVSLFGELSSARRDGVRAAALAMAEPDEVEVVFDGVP